MIESSSYLPFEKEGLCHSIDQTVIEFNDTVSRGAKFLPHVKIKNQTWETSQDGLEYFAGYMQGLSNSTKIEVEFEKKCIKSRFIQTIEEEYGWGDDLNSFSEACTTAREDLEKFFTLMGNREYDVALDEELVENIEDDLCSLNRITESIASALSEARDDYEPTYDNPGNPSVYAWLEEPETQWNHLCSNCKNLSCWFVESRKSLEILADATSSEKLLRGGIELLRKLPNGKKTRGKKDLRAADSDASLDNSVESITEIINLIRKAVLELPEEGKNLEELRRLREQQKNIILENKQPSDDNLIDDYINYYKTNTKILRIEETQRQMAAAFASVVSEQDIQTEKSVVYVQIKGKEPSSYRRLSVDIQSPLDSALVELISVTCKEEMRYSNLGAFLDLTQRTITKFEKGLLKTLGKSVDRTVCRHESFVSDAASSDSNNDYLENKIAKHPDYYSIFSLEQSTLPEVHVAGFDPELESIYGLFTILLAYHFADDANRQKKQLPSGHPIASLVVSEHGKILAWAINTIGSKPIDPIRHAEVNAIKSYFIQNPTQKRLPAGTRIFTSLKSCHMCAGAIEDSKGDEVRVVYGLDELSKNINNTDINGYETQISSDIVKQMD
ncbi:MAG: hypothetical protein KDK44_05600, partial [Chlamydiia bacterium]|nr:hypothetical protein [Chlamydiia bacterium]